MIASIAMVAVSLAPMSARIGRGVRGAESLGRDAPLFSQRVSSLVGAIRARLGPPELGYHIRLLDPIRATDARRYCFLRNACLRQTFSCCGGRFLRAAFFSWRRGVIATVKGRG